jgi:hypothetical protein
VLLGHGRQNEPDKAVAVAIINARRRVYFVDVLVVWWVSVLTMDSASAAICSGNVMTASPLAFNALG